MSSYERTPETTGHHFDFIVDLRADICLQIAMFYKGSVLHESRILNLDIAENELL